jgi:hypothetical protein
VWEHVPVVVVVVLSIVAIGCIIPQDPEYRDGGTPNSSPYIVWQSADPAFIPELSLTTTSKTQFVLKVGDADLEQDLYVRFCYLESSSNPDALIYFNEKRTGPSLDGSPDRKTVTSDPMSLCALQATNETHYLFVVVSDGGFTQPHASCEVLPGAGSAWGWWSFTCTDAP